MKIQKQEKTTKYKIIAKNLKEFEEIYNKKFDKYEIESINKISYSPLMSHFITYSEYEYEDIGRWKIILKETKFCQGEK